MPSGLQGAQKPHLLVGSALHGAKAAAAGLDAVLGVTNSCIPVETRQHCILRLRRSQSKPGYLQALLSPQNLYLGRGIMTIAQSNHQCAWNSTRM
jgi:hypothetical protein